MQTPFGTFELARYPHQERDSLRAWDAADELLLQELRDRFPAGISGRLLILNDGFGALSVALSAFAPCMLSDSFLARQGTLANLHHNGIAAESVTLLDSLQPLQGRYDVVLIKLPKSHAMLEHQLHRLRGHIDADTQLIGAAMVKAIHTNTLKLFERIIGPTTTSLARKKARLIHSTLDAALQVGDSPYPQYYTLELEGREYRIHNHANVFSREGLDIGTRFLLEHMPQGDYHSIIDLGCGNGVLGMVAGLLHPEAQLLFVDESYMAVDSARENVAAAFAAQRQARFEVGDGLRQCEPGTADLVLNNPPFHQQHALGDQVAWQMFADARRVLRQGGELWVIGNRHLGYHAKLKHLFGNCTTVASNSKFVILKARKG